jgi:hypothetical protein
MPRYGSFTSALRVTPRFTAAWRRRRRRHEYGSIVEAAHGPLSRICGSGARGHAQQGEIFSPEIATLFRWMLADSIGELDGERFLTGLNAG